MAEQMTLTIPEACEIFTPHITERQLRAIITALHWQPCGHRHTGAIGHPHPLYDATDLIRLHAGVAPWLGKAEP